MHLSKSRTFIKIKYIQTIVYFHLKFYNQKSIKSVNDFSRLFLILFISDNHTNQDNWGDGKICKFTTKIVHRSFDKIRLQIKFPRSLKIYFFQVYHFQERRHLNRHSHATNVYFVQERRHFNRR